MAEQTVILSPGESRVVSFKATPTKAKTYSVSVNGLTGSFTALAPEPAATITSIELDKTTVRQGENITVHAHIQSNFAGTAWIVTAHGRGTPSPGAGFRPLYNVQGDYLGWFPSGFDFVRFDPYTTGVNVGGRDLKVGDNSVSHTFGLRRNLPLGEYTIYVGVVPPAANWYQWDEPYDWAVSRSFTVLEEGPRLPVVEPMISQFLAGGSTPYGWGWATDIGLFSQNRNRWCWSELTWDEGIPQDYYMEFFSPRVERYTNHPHHPSKKPVRADYLAIGIMVGSDPPRTPRGYPAEFYTLEITGWLTYPDGHTEQKTLIEETPRPDPSSIYRWENFHIVPFDPRFEGGFRTPMALGKYTIRLKLVCKGITFVDETKSFTIVG